MKYYLTQQGRELLEVTKDLVGRAQASVTAGPRATAKKKKEHSLVQQKIARDKTLPTLKRDKAQVRSDRAWDEKEGAEAHVAKKDAQAERLTTILKHRG